MAGGELETVMVRVIIVNYSMITSLALYCHSTKMPAGRAATAALSSARLCRDINGLLFIKQGR